MLRRRKEDVLNELPDKIRVPVPFPIDDVHKKVSHNALESFKGTL